MLVVLHFSTLCDKTKIHTTNWTCLVVVEPFRNAWCMKRVCARGHSPGPVILVQANAAFGLYINDGVRWIDYN